MILSCENKIIFPTQIFSLSGNSCRLPRQRPGLISCLSKSCLRKLQRTRRMSRLVATHRRRGRPMGAPGPAPVLSGSQLHKALRAARTRKRHAARTEAALALSIGAGLRAKEIAGLKWQDVYDQNGKVRYRVDVSTAYARQPRTRVVFLSSPLVREALERYGEQNWLLCIAGFRKSLFLSQKGGPMTAPSIARSLRYVYQEAGIAHGTSLSGRRTFLNRIARSGENFALAPMGAAKA